MSASSKKKLRKEQDAAKMTEKQLTEQKEAKKLTLYTTIFVAAVALMLVVAIVVGVNQTIANSGIREKKTVALTVGDHEISNAELNYFYIDAINNFYSTYGSYASLFGLDVTAPLDEQILDEESGLTWADDFLTSAKSNAKSVYAMADAAEAAGFTLSNEEELEIEYSVNNIGTYALLYGFEDADAYLKAMYGKGASEESYLAYAKLTSLADAYYTAYGESLTYEDADLRAAEADNYDKYSSYSYNYYYLSASKFLSGGTTDDEGNTTYSDEEKAASVLAAETAANSLTVEEIASVEDFDAAIAALSVNADTTASSTSYENQLYSSISSTMADWITDDARVAGDKTVIASTSTSTDEEGNETTTTNGYYVIYFVGSNDNTMQLKNVRHILVGFSGGTTDETTGTTTYTDEEKAAAKASAEELLAEWESDPTEENFADMANNHSDDGDGTTGGLYENVYPGQMVEAFEDWCYDEARNPGDTGIIETQYGYHIMYFVGNSTYTYRDYQIENELRSADLSAWYSEVVEAVTVTDGNTKYISTDLVLSNG